MPPDGVDVRSITPFLQIVNVPLGEDATETVGNAFIVTGCVADTLQKPSFTVTE